MRIPRIHLHRLGSDPEFLFVNNADFDFLIVPASTVLGTNKAKTTASFIGTDSRPILGEIRPSPFRNLKGHLFELAYGLDSVYKYLSEKHPGTQVLAYPEFHGETLGGHIHASFFAEEPVLTKWQKLGYNVAANATLQPAQPQQAPLPVGPGQVNTYHTAMANREFMTPYDWAQIMHWFLVPFENWIQPWTARMSRNEHYGGDKSQDVVRLGTSKIPKYVGKGPAWLERAAYLHWEYRMPSTWLHHPCLAYTYLALAKLTMLNFSYVAESYKNYRPMKKMPVDGDQQFHNYKQMQPAENEIYSKLLHDRLVDLYSNQPRMTKDLLVLNQMIEQCGAKRREWFYTPNPVAIEEWRKILVQ